MIIKTKKGMKEEELRNIAKIASDTIIIGCDSDIEISQSVDIIIE